MGQKLDSMKYNNNKRSPAQLLYEMVHTGNVEAIRALHKNGATLEVFKNLILASWVFTSFEFIYINIYILCVFG